jgi:hypothetical protein
MTLTIDWGSVPDWFAAAGGFLAVVFAGIAARTAFRAYRVQQRSLAVQRTELKSLLDDKRQEQADQIAAWVEQKPSETRPGRPAPSSSTTTRVLVVQNSSSLPVYAVYIRLLWNHDEARNPAQTIKTVLPPGRTEIEVDGEVSSRFATVTILFADASNVRWVRNGFGQLYEIEPSHEVELMAEFQSGQLSPRFPEGATGVREVRTIQEPHDG